MGHNGVVGGHFPYGALQNRLLQSLRFCMKLTKSLMRSRRVCPGPGKAIPPFFRSTTNSYCFIKHFQLCASLLQRPARAHCTQQGWGQPWLEAAAQFCICICVTLLFIPIHLSPSATSADTAPAWGSAPVLGHILFVVMGCKHSSLKRGFQMRDLSAHLPLILLC